jgi:hypothetical protein
VALAAEGAVSPDAGAYIVTFDERVDSVWREALQRCTELARGEHTTTAILRDVLGLDPADRTKAVEMRVAALMKGLGFRRRLTRDRAGATRRTWVRA